MNRKRNVDIKEIYNRVIVGEHSSKIAKSLGVSRVYVSRAIARFESGGYIRCINRKGKPKVYEATKKIFNRSTLVPLSPVMLTRSCGRHEIVKIQKSSFRFNIIIKPLEAKWDKEYTWSNNKSVQVQQYTHPFEHGSVMFRRFLSKNDDFLMIILPQMMLPENEMDNSEAILTEMATMAGAWIQKRFKMGLGLPEPVQKPHYAVAPREPELVKAFKKGSYKVGEMMGDSSPPDKLSEVESTNPRDITNYLHSIAKIKTLEDELQEMRQMQKQLIDTVSQMAKAQKEFCELMGTGKEKDLKREQEGIDRGIM